MLSREKKGFYNLEGFFIQVALQVSLNSHLKETETGNKESILVMWKRQLWTILQGKKGHDSTSKDCWIKVYVFD